MTDGFPRAILFDAGALLDRGGWAYDGVAEMLAALQTAGYSLGILVDAASESAARLRLGEFDVVVADDRSGPERLRIAAERLGAAPAEVIYAAATTAALEAGRAGGMRTAAALWARTGEGEAERFVKEIQALSPDRVFARPAELTRAFARWC
jgi:phosphoglycolate phosphatase-like HAD superfamily hydrolase